MQIHKIQKNGTSKNMQKIHKLNLNQLSVRNSQVCAYRCYHHHHHHIRLKHSDKTKV